MTNPPVVLYALRECPHCEAARQFLRARGVAFVERDLRAESGAIHDLAKVTGESIVPTIVYGDDVQIGWDAARVTEMLDDPLPPEEDDQLLAVIEAATEPDSDWPTPSDDDDVLPSSTGGQAPTPSTPPPGPLSVVSNSSGTAVESAEVPGGPPPDGALHKSSGMTEIG